MEDFNRFKKQITLQMLVTAALAAAVCLALDALPAAKGLVLGSLFSLVNFHVMAGLTPGRLGNSRRAATIRGLGGIAVRLALMAVPLYLALTRADISFIGAAAGLFNLQASVIVYSRLGRRFGLVGGA